MSVNEKNISDFWASRVVRYGHTGWSNPVIYYYDQCVRLLAVKQVVQSLKGNIKKCLDYGCGIGDFSHMLAKTNKTVIAYDINDKILEKARIKNQLESIAFSSNEQYIFEKSYDLILSITVLQHIENKKKLEEVINNFHNCLDKNGYLVILESIDVNNKSSHVFGKSRNQWIDLLEKKNFILSSEYYFYHPTLSPTSTYISYSKNIEVQVLGLLCRTILGSKLFKKRLGSIANEYAQQDFEYFQDNETPSILMVWKKNTE